MVRALVADPVWGYCLLGVYGWVGSGAVDCCGRLFQSGSLSRKDLLLHQIGIGSVVMIDRHGLLLWILLLEHQLRDRRSAG